MFLKMCTLNNDCTFNQQRPDETHVKVAINKGLNKNYSLGSDRITPVWIQNAGENYKFFDYLTLKLLSLKIFSKMMETREQDSLIKQIIIYPSHAQIYIAFKFVR